MDSQNDGVRAHDAIEKAILGRQDIDPVADLTKLLRDMGHPNPEAWTDGLDQRAYDQTRGPEERRYHVNNQWRQIIGLVEHEDTTRARYCLVDKGPLDVWLVLFKQSVLPVVLRNNLPNDAFFWKDGPSA